ncbi:MAG: hypothetical protein GY773_12770, partial [Actinomycetia bacterium]|nr:hypothetical protein [Actinomycetes bacterium]
MSSQGDSDPAVPFSGGVLGYLGYGAGAAVEAVPQDGPTPEPPVWLGQYDGGLCFHHPTASWRVAGSASFRRRANEALDRAR